MAGGEFVLPLARELRLLGLGGEGSFVLLVVEKPGVAGHGRGMSARATGAISGRGKGHAKGRGAGRSRGKGTGKGQG